MFAGLGEPKTKPNKLNQPNNDFMNSLFGGGGGNGPQKARRGSATKDFVLDDKYRKPEDTSNTLRYFSYFCIRYKIMLLKTSGISICGMIQSKANYIQQIKGLQIHQKYKSHRK